MWDSHREARTARAFWLTIVQVVRVVAVALASVLVPKPPLDDGKITADEVRQALCGSSDLDCGAPRESGK